MQGQNSIWKLQVRHSQPSLWRSATPIQVWASLGPDHYGGVHAITQVHAEEQHRRRPGLWPHCRLSLCLRLCKVWKPGFVTLIWRWCISTTVLWLSALCKPAPGVAQHKTWAPENLCISHNRVNRTEALLSWALAMCSNCTLCSVFKGSFMLVVSMGSRGRYAAGHLIVQELYCCVPYPHTPTEGRRT